MPDTKLLPCPFCGGPADVLARPLGVAVECRWCDSSIGEVIHDAAAIEKWNTRAALQASGKGEPLSEEQIVIASRVLNALASVECGIDEGDSWKTYGESYIADMREVVAKLAAHGIQAKGDKLWATVRKPSEPEPPTPATSQASGL